MLNFVTKALLRAKMKDVPQEQQDMIFTLIEKNPDFFKELADELQQEIAKGVNQTTAMMNVMKRHETELKKLAGK